MQITDIIFCEDIRFELNSKLSLMGVYSDQIIFHSNPGDASEIKWPVATHIALLLRFRIETNEKLPNQFTFEYFLKGNAIANVQGNLKTDTNQSTMSLALLTPILPLEPGYLGFKINLFDKQELLFSHESKEAIKIIDETKS